MPSFTFTFNDDVVEKPALWSNTKKISFEDYLELTACVFNWGDSYDAKAIRNPKSAPSISINICIGLGPSQEHPRSNAPR